MTGFRSASPYAAPSLPGSVNSQGAWYNDYQFIHEHCALAADQANPPTYRYVKLPPAVGLWKTRQDMRYGQAVTVVPGLGIPDSAPQVAIHATRVM